MSWLRTYTGKRFYPLAPEQSEIDIEDVAHALSNQCRFAGHTSSFYSVAEHSCLVARILYDRGSSIVTQFAGLLHDASEAYITDLPMPIKESPQLAEFKMAERRLDQRVQDHFGLGGALWHEVKIADRIALATEARDLMGNPKDWETLYGIEPHPAKIRSLEPKEAKLTFLACYRDLKKRIDGGSFR